MDLTRKDIIKLIAIPRRTDYEYQIKLNGVNLNEIDLSKLDLTGINFKSANMRKSNLANCDLRGVDLSFTELNNANLMECWLESSNLYYANLNNANLRQADLREANLDKSKFINTNLSHAILCKASLIESTFSNSYLVGANFRNTYLSETSFIGSNLENTYFSNANLVGVYLAGLNMKRCEMNNANLENANLENANLENSELINVNFKGANLMGANLVNANLEGANLKGANLEGAKLTNTKLKDTILDDANLKGVDLNNIFKYDLMDDYSSEDEEDRSHEYYDLQYGGFDKDCSTILFFDIETSSLPVDWKAPYSDLNNWPYIVQIAWLMSKSSKPDLYDERDYILQPKNFKISKEAEQIHGLTTKQCHEEGWERKIVLQYLANLISISDFVVAHNAEFDINVLRCELIRNKIKDPFENTTIICTMRSSTNYCKIPTSYGDYKWPTLSELHSTLFDIDFEEAHNAKFDIQATYNCFWKLKELGVIDLDNKDLEIIDDDLPF